MRAGISLIMVFFAVTQASGQSKPDRAKELQSAALKHERQTGPKKQSVRSHIRGLLEKQQYEKAANYIAKVLPNSEDKSYLYLKLSQTELERRNHKESFEAFVKALDLLPRPSSSEPRDPQIERQLNVVSLVRMHKGYKVASMILEAMLESNRQCPSILYELSYLRANQQKVNDFLVDYYYAYKLDPGSPRGLPGQALIKDVTTAERAPKPGDFPWLETAAYYYDNPKAWANAVLALKKHNMLDDAKVVKKLIEKKPDDIRAMFYYFYYALLERQEAKLEAVRSIKSRAGKDWRFERFRRGLLLEAGLESKALEEAGSEPADPYERIFYYDFWMAYYHAKQLQLDEKGLKAFKGLINAVLEFVRPIVSSPQKQAEITDDLVHHIARLRIDKHDYRSAIDLLKSHEGDLSAANCEVVASLYLSLDNQKEAIKWLRKRLRRCAPSEREEAARTVIKYSVLVDDFATAGECLKYAEQQNLDSVVADYENLVNGKQAAELSHHRIANVPGYYTISNEPPWRSARSGSCARASAYSVISFYEENLTYDQVSKDIDMHVGEQNLPLQSYAIYFKAKGFGVVYFAPAVEVAKKLVAGDKPLLLLRTILTAGITVGHVSVLKAFDDRSAEFFLDDISGVTAATVSYDRLIDSQALVLVAPADSVDKLVAESLSVRKEITYTKQALIEGGWYNSIRRGSHHV